MMIENEIVMYKIVSFTSCPRKKRATDGILIIIRINFMDKTMQFYLSPSPLLTSSAFIASSAPVAKLTSSFFGP